ncbi:hypothetical protein PENTCL1PPCAC_8218 [Pristionchus entomophagus]|uniref:Uncharacterized protein n=1 Tax=Pristionchus entomophagus TaxID=358040 RepID=A0AAV5SSC1_9BILA|nr:hypothetical protein PENTCL1PPCAC_8218 [Pristionchus entomophagus]
MSSSSRRSGEDKSQDLRPESPLSDRSPRQRDSTSKKSAEQRLSPKTPLPLPNSTEVPKHPRRYFGEHVTNIRMEDVHRPSDRRVQVDLEEIEREVRGGTPSSSLSMPDSNDSLVVSEEEGGGPKTSTPKKSSSRKSHRAPPDSLYKRVLMRSASRTAVGPRPASDTSMDSYRTAQESMMNSSVGSSMSPIRIETRGGYRIANSTQRALFSQQGAAPLRRHLSTRSPSRSRRSPAPSGSILCQLVTPLAVHTAQEVNAVSVTGQILVISQTLIRSAHVPSDVRRLMHHLAGKIPLISNEMSQVDIDHDNEHSKHEVFVGSDAILIQRVSTIHRGRDRNSFETDDRRTYRFICQGDLLPEDRRNKQSKSRHLTIVAESTTVKDCEEIEKSERVMLVFDAAEKPAHVLAPAPPETSLTHANDLTSKPSALKDSPVSFEEHVRVSDHSHINIVRKARVNSCTKLWDEPLTELKEQRVYKQQLDEEADCEPVRITRSHSMSRRAPTGDRSLSRSRIERGRTPGRAPRNVSSAFLTMSPLAAERRRQLRPDCTPSAPLSSDLLTGLSPIKDEPARRENPLRPFNIDDDSTVHDSRSLPARTTASGPPSPTPKTLNRLQTTLRVSRSPSPAAIKQEPQTPPEVTATAGPFRSPRSNHRTPIKESPTLSVRLPYSPLL